MIRTSTFALATLGAAATVIAAVTLPALSQAPDRLPVAQHMTVIEKNQAFPQIGPLVLEPCETEDCSASTS